MLRPRSERPLVALTAIVWVIVTVAGVFAVHSYEATPGASGSAAEAWPAGSRIRPQTGRATLVLFAHSRCPCTRASLDELARILRSSGRPVSAHVLFYRPRAGRGSWGPSDLWHRAATIPGVRIHDDPGGVEARHFGAPTSGAVRLFDETGRLLFAGGITRGRGRAGASTGGDALLALLSGARTAEERAPVFGCPIFDLPETGGTTPDAR